MGECVTWWLEKRLRLERVPVYCPLASVLCVWLWGLRVWNYALDAAHRNVEGAGKLLFPLSEELRQALAGNLQQPLCVEVYGCMWVNV